MQDDTERTKSSQHDQSARDVTVGPVSLRDGFRPERHYFIERITGWLMPDRNDPDLAVQARESTSLDGVYAGKSRRIHQLVRLAYLRGVRRGAAAAWEAQQPIVLRDDERSKP